MKRGYFRRILLTLIIFVGVVPGCGQRAMPPAKVAPDVIQTTPTALSETGRIVGSMRAAVDALPAFVEVEGVQSELSLPPDATWGLPCGVNTRGQIVGFVNLRRDQTRHAALWDGARPVLLNDAGAQSSEACALNSRGAAAGFRWTANRGFHACLWRKGVLEELEPLSRARCLPTGINDRGEIVGWGLNSANETHLYVWREKTLTDLGRGYHIAINNRGEIAGDCETPDHHFHACVWNGAQRRLLPDLPGASESHALALNDRGQIVGRATISTAERSSPSDQPHPVLWQNNNVLDLNTLPPPNSAYTLEEAIAINNAGQILCTARQVIWGRAALLTPTGSHWNVRCF